MESKTDCVFQEYGMVEYMPNVTDNWIWCQFTPGAGGKMLSTILQLSKNVHSWNETIDKDFTKYVEDKIVISKNKHMKNEPHFPYKLNWFTRQLPFSRGDELTDEEVQKHFTEQNKINADQILIMPWFKPYLPKWFRGRVLRILNDKDSMDWLRKRRDDIFYRWDGNTVYHKRWMPEEIANNSLATKFSDNPEWEEVFESKDVFYEKEFFNHPEVSPMCAHDPDTRIKLEINLSDLLKKDSQAMVMECNRAFGLDIDLSKAKYLIDSWRNNNDYK